MKRKLRDIIKEMGSHHHRHYEIEMKHRAIDCAVIIALGFVLRVWLVIAMGVVVLTYLAVKRELHAAASRVDATEMS